MMHRPKDRIELYIERSLKPKKKHHSVLSRYYQIGDFIIRVSDHLSEVPVRFQILINRNNNDYYVIYLHKRKDPSVLTYEELKYALRIWKMFPQLYTPMIVEKNNKDINTVLGVPITYFDVNTKKKIIKYARKVRKEKSLSKWKQNKGI